MHPGKSEFQNIEISKPEVAANKDKIHILPIPEYVPVLQTLHFSPNFEMNLASKVPLLAVPNEISAGSNEPIKIAPEERNLNGNLTFYELFPENARTGDLFELGGDCIGNKAQGGSTSICPNQIRMKNIGSLISEIAKVCTSSSDDIYEASLEIKVTGLASLNLPEGWSNQDSKKQYCASSLDLTAGDLSEENATIKRLFNLCVANERARNTASVLKDHLGAIANPIRVNVKPHKWHVDSYAKMAGRIRFKTTLPMNFDRDSSLLGRRADIEIVNLGNCELADSEIVLN